MNKRFAISLFLALAAYGQQQERVAILNTVDDGGDSIGIPELTYLTDRFRETAVNVLPKSRYGVMTTESIIGFLGSQERAIKECKAASCLAELGRKVSADYVAQARIGRFEGDLTIKAELYSSKSGNLLGSFTGDSKSLQGLRTLIDEKAPILFKKMPGTSVKMKPESLSPNKTLETEKQALETERQKQALEIEKQRQALEIRRQRLKMGLTPYENFSTVRRFGTWAVNLTLNGLGSWLLMGDVRGGFVHFGLGVASVVSMALADKENRKRDCFSSDCDNNNTYDPFIVIFLGSGGVWNIYRSITYDKPKLENEYISKYGGFNMAVLPSKQSGLKAYLMYNKIF
jgi:hypothetical protein